MDASSASSGVSGKIAVVTGASSGIGRASAIALSRAGWTCVLAGRRLDALEEVKQTIGEQTQGTAKTLIVQGDLTQLDQVDILFEKTIEAFGRVDLLFNNAGASLGAKDIDEIALSDFEHLVRLNITVPFACARLAFGHMKRQEPQGGRIINNGSISAHVPRPGSSPYTVTKHAITGLTKSIALDGRPYMIACTQIDIGNANTSMVQQAEQLRQASKPAEATMDVAHVANTIVHVASLPVDVTVLNLTVMATQIPFVGRG